MENISSSANSDDDASVIISISSSANSDDDASVIISHDIDDDELTEKNDKEQEMEITSSDVCFKDLDNLMQSKDKFAEPDSTSKILETSQILQTEKIYVEMEDNLEVTSNIASNSFPSLGKDLFNSHSDSSNKEQNSRRLMTESDEVCEIHEHENRTEDRKERPFNIPRKKLQNMIARAIISSMNGYLSVEEIIKCTLPSVHCSGDQIGRLRNLIINTLENNADMFMSHIIKKENYPEPIFEIGHWTLHPLAAAKFVYCDTIGKNTSKQQNQDFANKDHTTKYKGKPSVAMKRSSKLDYWASKTKVAKTADPAMIIPAPNVINTLKDYGISFEMKWEGWSAPDREQENKISRLEAIVNNYKEPDTTGFTKVAEKQKTQQKLTPPVNVLTKPLLLQSKGVKQYHLSDSDADSSDNETRSDESIVYKEHNYVASKDASGSRNLIENLRKIVKKMDKNSDKTFKNQNCERELSCSKNEDKEEDFLGFDYDLSSGYWRGWEKASSKNADRMKEIIRSQEGNRDLEEVLKESNMAVSKYIEELECDLLRKNNFDSPKPCDLDTRIQKIMEELMSLFDHTEEEPPMSYLVLTVMAMCASPEPALTTEEICHFIQQHFPFHRRVGLLCAVDVILRLQTPTTFTCQKSRKLTNYSTCWKVNTDSAFRILDCALKSAKSRSKSNRSPQKPRKYSPDYHDLPVKELEVEEDHQKGVIVDTHLLESSKQTSQSKHNLKKGERLASIIGNTSKYQKSISDVPAKSTSVPSHVTSETKNINNVKKSAVVSVISSVELMKKNVIPSNLEKNVESSSPEKVNLIKSPSNHPAIFKEDQELEIIDIDSPLQDKENSNLSSDDDDVIMIDDAIDYEAEKHHNSFNVKHERFFGSKQSSIDNESFIEGCDKTSCSFLLRCRNLDFEIKKYPCYICHKFYGSDEILNIHFAQTHFGKENTHLTSVLCQTRRKKTKNKETKNMIISPESSLRSDVISSKPKVESLQLQLKRSGGVIRYSCSKCNAIFHEKETLNLHTSVFHGVEDMRSLVPLKKVCTPEGNKFFYCDKCSGCFHTEKALLVHSCVPFSRARSSST